MGYLFNKTGNMLTNIYLNYFTFSFCRSIATSQKATAMFGEKEFDAQIFMEICFYFSVDEKKTSSGNFCTRGDL